MDSSGIFLNIGKSILALAIALFVIFWFPSPAFDACFPDNNSYVCGQWPKIFAGCVFTLVSYFLGPKSKYHYFPVFMLFAYIGSAEHIRFGGQLLDVLLQIPFQTFYYGGIIALVIIIAVKFIKRNWVQSVPNKLFKRDK